MGTRVSAAEPQKSTAATSGGQVELIDRCAAAYDLPPDCPEAASRAGLVSVGRTVEFRHPLVRSAIYGAAPGAQRRRIHAALAEHAGGLDLVALEAWHSAEVAAGAAALSRDLLDRVDTRRLSPVQRGRLLMAQSATAMFVAPRPSRTPSPSCCVGWPHTCCCPTPRRSR